MGGFPTFYGLKIWKFFCVALLYVHAKFWTNLRYDRISNTENLLIVTLVMAPYNTGWTAFFKK